MSIESGPCYLAKLADEVVKAVMVAVPAAAGELEPLLSPSEQVMVERPQLKIRGIAKKMQARLTGKSSSAYDPDA